MAKNETVQGTTARLAEWAAQLSYDEIPAETRDYVELLILDTIASAIAGRSGREAAMVEDAARALAPGASTTVIAGPPQSPLGAVLVNAYQVTAANVCDVYRPSLCHVTPEVIPPALAAAEETGASGRELVAAVAAGLETVVRIGQALVYEEFRSRGWHSPGVIGPFGGAVAAGRLLGLDAKQMTNALSMSGSQSGGTFAQWGTPGVKFHQCRGAVAGFVAARLAATDFTVAEEIFTAPDGGLLNVFSNGGNPQALTHDLGRHWELENISVRLWPAGSSIQGAISSIFDLIDQHDTQPHDIEKLRIRLSPDIYKMHGEMGFDARFQALLSVRYCASVVLHDRTCWLDQFTQERLRDNRVRAFAKDVIEVYSDEAVPSNGATVEARLTDGRTIAIAREIARGDARDRASMKDIKAKFELSCRNHMSDDRARDLLQGFAGLNEVKDVSAAITALGAPKQ